MRQGIRSLTDTGAWLIPRMRIEGTVRYGEWLCESNRTVSERATGAGVAEVVDRRAPRPGPDDVPLVPRKGRGARSLVTAEGAEQIRRRAEFVASEFPGTTQAQDSVADDARRRAMLLHTEVAECE